MLSQQLQIPGGRMVVCKFAHDLCVHRCAHMKADDEMVETGVCDACTFDDQQLLQTRAWLKYDLCRERGGGRPAGLAVVAFFVHTHKPTTMALISIRYLWPQRTSSSFRCRYLYVNEYFPYSSLISSWWKPRKNCFMKNQEILQNTPHA
jgi:hypothetical protein